MSDAAPATFDSTAGDTPAPPAPDVSPVGGAAEVFCPQCGYSLRGIADADRCPECGLVIDREGFGRTRIPWAYRRHIGRPTAFWRTVRLATLQPKRLAAESVKPVDYRDAQRFRIVTAFLTAAPFALLVGGLAFWHGGAGFLNVTGPGVFAGLAFGANRPGGPAPWLLNVAIPWEAGVTLAPVLPVAIFVGVALATGVASYWFHPGALPVVRQNRAVALSHYACGPLVFAWVPLAAFAAIAGLHEAELVEPDAGFAPVLTFLWTIALVGGAAVLAVWIRATLVLLRRTTHAGMPRLLTAAAALPLTWAFCAALGVVGLPWTVGFIRLVVGSLRE